MVTDMGKGILALEGLELVLVRGRAEQGGLIGGLDLRRRIRGSFLLFRFLLFFSRLFPRYYAGLLFLRPRF